MGSEWTGQGSVATGENTLAKGRFTKLNALGVRIRDVLTQPLPKWRDHPPQYWAMLANRYLPLAVTPILTLTLAYLLARLTWTLIPGAPVDGPVPVVNTEPFTPPAAVEIDIQGIMEQHLFGEVSAEPEAPTAISVVEAPDTTLNLRLTAVVADARDDRRGAAIIATEREEKTYTVGDVIDGTQGVQLHAIHGDRVLLNRAGQLEALRLPEKSLGESTQANVTVIRDGTPLILTIDTGVLGELALGR